MDKTNILRVIFREKSYYPIRPKNSMSSFIKTEAVIPPYFISFFFSFIDLLKHRIS